MKKSKFTEEQIAFALHQAQTGTSVEEVCRKVSVSQATFYAWKKKFGGMGVSELRRLRQLEEENRKPRAGQKVLTLRGAMPREDRARQPQCADIDGFSLHAAVRVQAHDRKRLEQLCRYITRPALSDERVQLNAAGQVELKLPKFDTFAALWPPLKLANPLPDKHLQDSAG